MASGHRSTVETEARSAQQLSVSVAARIPNTSLHGPRPAGGTTGEETVVDFVYCWAGQDTDTVGVSDSERIWPPLGDTEKHSGQGHNELWYSLRSLEAFAPWAHYAYVLSGNPAHLPIWFQPGKKVKIIDRCSLFDDPNDCPTNNTHACQTVVHRIPGLSERFVYMEDDYFLARPLSINDFFAANGQPLILAAPGDIRPVYGLARPNGADLPPAKVPNTTDRFNHMPVPMSLSFSKRLELEFRDWFSFVRSHKQHRFTCCDASIDANGLEEDLVRIYPVMLSLRSAGVVRFEPDGYCRFKPHIPDALPCLRHKLTNGQKFANMIDGCNTTENPTCLATMRKEFSLLSDHFGTSSGLFGIRNPPFAAGSSNSELQGFGLPYLTIIRGGLIAASCVLIFMAVKICWLMGRLPSSFMGFTTFLELVFLMLFISLCTGHTFMQRDAGSTGYSVIAATVLIYSLKTLFAAVMYAPHFDYKHMRSCFVPGTSSWGTPLFVLPLVSGVSYCAYDVISFMALARIDPVTYEMCLRGRMILLALMWQFVFKRSLSKAQWTGICLFACSAAGVTMDQVTHRGTAGLFGVCLTFVQNVINIAASLANEKLLKEVPMQTDLLNVVTYLWSLVVLLAYVAITDGGMADIMSSVAWARLLADKFMICSIIMLAIYGITVAYFLKLFSSVHKEVVGCIVCVLTAIVEWAVLGRSLWSSVGVTAVASAVFGIVMFSFVGFDNDTEDIHHERATGQGQEQPDSQES